MRYEIESGVKRKNKTTKRNMQHTCTPNQKNAGKIRDVAHVQLCRHLFIVLVPNGTITADPHPGARSARNPCDMRWQLPVLAGGGLFGAFAALRFSYLLFCLFLPGV